MPLADDVGGVAGVAQSLAPQRRLFRQPVGPKGGKPRVQHRPAGNAHGPRPGTLVKAVSKRTAALHQPIEIGCLDFRIVQTVNGTVCQVVGDQKQEVRARAAGSQRELGCQAAHGGGFQEVATLHQTDSLPKCSAGVNLFLAAAVLGTCILPLKVLPFRRGGCGSHSRSPPSVE